MSNDLIQKKSQANKGLAFFLFLIIADQISKVYAPNIFRNHNFAFSIPLNVYLMYGIYFAAIGGIVVYIVRHFWILSGRELAAWALIASGAVSNVGERLVLGYVRDWIYIANGVFNLADFFIILGIIILLLNSKTEILKSKQIPNFKL